MSRYVCASSGMLLKEMSDSNSDDGDGYQNGVATNESDDEDIPYKAERCYKPEIVFRWVSIRVF
jgi:hypothetical protein